MRPYVVAILLAGGSSSRYKGDIPKQFDNLAGRPLVSYALDSLNACQQIDSILLVVPPGMVEEATKLIQPDHWHKLNQPFIAGGDRRCDSCYQALKHTETYSPDSLVLVHDAARPFVSQSLLEKTVEMLKDYAGVVPALPMVDSLARTIPNTDTIQPVPRDQLFQLQTPQGFSLKLLRSAYDFFYQQPATFEPTDDCSLVLNYKKQTPIKLIKGEVKNAKLTYADDLPLFELWAET